MAVSHFSSQFQISARAETSHVITANFQPGGRDEICHVIGPKVGILVKKYSQLSHKRTPSGIGKSVHQVELSAYDNYSYKRTPKKNRVDVRLREG